MHSLPYLKKLPSKVEIEAELCRRRLRHYIAGAWSVVEPGRPYKHNWHIDAVAEHLEAVYRGEIRRIVINIPPRTMKSLSVSVMWPTWVWAQDPAFRWIFSSYAGDLATRDSVKCRDVIQSPWYQDRFGHMFNLKGDQNLKTRFENDKGGLRVAVGIGGMVTGEGGDCVVADDPHDVKRAHSDALRQQAIDFWTQTIPSRLNDPKSGRKVIVMQRLHDRDLTGHVLAESLEYDHLCLPMEYEAKRSVVTSIGFKDPRTTEGELLWPDHIGPKEVTELQTELGSYGYAGQYQQRPSPAEGGMVKRNWWQYYTEAPDYLDEIIITWDMTFKDPKAAKAKKGPDYVVGQVWGRKGAFRYKLDQKRGQWDFPTTKKEVLTLSGKWPQARRVSVEDKANGPAIIAELKAQIRGITAWDPGRMDKKERVAAVSPQIEAGQVFLPLKAPWISDYVERFAAFPNCDYDDEIDATTQALLVFGKPKIQVATAADLRRLKSGEGLR